MMNVNMTIWRTNKRTFLGGGKGKEKRISMVACGARGAR